MLGGTKGLVGVVVGELLRLKFGTSVGLAEQSRHGSVSTGVGTGTSAVGMLVGTTEGISSNTVGLAVGMGAMVGTAVPQR